MSKGEQMSQFPTGFGEYLEATRTQPLYVILGVQGSGTNLLSRLLMRIFGFSVLRDRSTVFNAAAKLGATPGRHDVVREIERFRRLVSPSRVDRVLGRRFLNRDGLFDGIFAELTPAAIRSGSDFARLIYAYQAYSLGARHMAIKSDDIWQQLNQIDAVIPNRRIILLTRDFRDNLVSIGGKQFGPIEPICAARYVKRRFECYEAEYRRAGPNGFHVRFETLVQAPRQFVEEFSRHFGVAPTSDPDTVLENFRFRPNKIAKWKSLSTDNLAWCEAILRDELATFGYEAVSPPVEQPGRAVLAAANLRDIVKRIPQKLRGLAERLN